jgi:hypothetical protein
VITDVLEEQGRRVLRRAELGGGEEDGKWAAPGSFAKGEGGENNRFEEKKARGMGENGSCEPSPLKLPSPNGVTLVRIPHP